MADIWEVFIMAHLTLVFLFFPSICPSPFTCLIDQNRVWDARDVVRVVKIWGPCSIPLRRHKASPASTGF